MGGADRSLRTAVVALFLLLSSAPAGRASALYSVTDLGNAADIRFGGMNDAGQVVGATYNSKSGKGYAFVYDGTPAGTITPLGGSSDPTNYPAVRDSWPLAINNNGQIVGVDLQGTATGAKNSTFVYSNGQVITLPGSASSINDRGQVAGGTWNYAAGTPASSYLYNLATQSVQYLNQPSFAPSGANAANNSGQIVGVYYISPSATYDSARGYLYSNGKMVDLGTLGGTSVIPGGINSQGEIVGYGTTANGQTHGFLYSNGVMKDLGVLNPGDTMSWASSINNQGQIVGMSGGPNSHGGGGYLYSNGVMTSLNSLIGPNPPWDITWGMEINNRGQILALADNQTGEHELLLTPSGLPIPGTPTYPTIVPEPCTWILFGVLAGGLLIRHHRQGRAETQSRIKFNQYVAACSDTKDAS